MPLLLTLAFWAVLSVPSLAIPSPEELLAQLNAAVSTSAGAFTIPQGVYRFNSTALTIQGASKMQIDGSGSLFLFHVGAGVRLKDCTQVSLANATIAYDPPAGTQGTLAEVSADGQHATARLDDGWPGLAEFVGYAGGTTECYLWSVDTASMIQGCGAVVGDDPSEVNVSGTSLAAGMRVSLFNRHGYTLDLVNCTECGAAHVEIISGSFMSVTEFGGTGANQYAEVTVRRQPGPYSSFVSRLGTQVHQPLMSSNADLFHSYAVRQGPTLTGCTFHNAADDFFNMHNELSVAFTQAEQMYLIDTHISAGFVDSPGGVYGDVNSLDYVRVGDTLGVYAFDSFAPLANATIVSVSRVPAPGQDVIAAAQAALQAGKSMPQINVSSHIYTVTLESVVALPAGGAFGDVLEIRGQGAVVTGCDFANTNCNLGRWKASNSLIADNTFGPAKMCNLEVTALTGWNEGPASIDNVTITNNDFSRSGCPNTSIHVGAMAHSVVVTDNTWP